MESMGHIIRFLITLAGSITIKPLPYRTDRHRVFKITLQISITTNLANSTLQKVMGFL